MYGKITNILPFTQTIDLKSAFYCTKSTNCAEPYPLPFSPLIVMTGLPDFWTSNNFWTSKNFSLLHQLPMPLADILPHIERPTEGEAGKGYGQTEQRYINKVYLRQTHFYITDAGTR